MTARGRAAGVPIAAAIAVAMLAAAASSAVADQPSLLDSAIAPPTARASASKLEVTLGEPFVVFVTVELGADLEVNLAGRVELGNAFEVGVWTSSDVRQPDGSIRRDYELQVTPWELGELIVPPVQVSWFGGGRSGVVLTNPIALRVLGTLAGEDGDLRPLARPVPLASRDWTLVWIAAAAGAAIALVLAAFGWRRHRRRRRVRVRIGGASIAVAAGSPEADALRDLDALEAGGALAAAELAPAFDAMAEVVRRYLARRFAVTAHELTTGELIEALTARPAAAAVTPLVGPWFVACDLVRYAKARPAAADARRAFDDARQLVAAGVTEIPSETPDDAAVPAAAGDSTTPGGA